MATKKDIRFTRTEQALFETFYTLLCQKKFHNITINEICAQACVSRTTFYLHFIDKYQLVESFLNTLKYSTEKDDNQMVIDRILTILQDHRKAFSHLLIGDQEIEKVLSQWLLKDFFHEYTEKEKQGKLYTVSPKLISIFYTAGFISLLTSWLNEELYCSKEEMKRFLCKIQEVELYQ